MAVKSGGVVVNFSVNAANYSAGINKIIQMNKQAAASAKEAGHASVSQMQATSGALRTLEGGMNNNLRAAERFVASIPGVGKALQAAFPVVGVIAVGGMIAKTTQEVVKFIKELNLMPQAITDGFGSLNSSVQTANDGLALTNDTLRNHIALMQGKPVNNVAIALDEARIAADKLSASLRKDQEEVTKLLKANSIGMMGELLGKGATGDVEGTINYGEREMSNLGIQYNSAVHSGDKVAAANALKALSDKQAYYLKWAADQQKKRTGDVFAGRAGITDYDAGSGIKESYSQAYGDQDANLALLSGFGTSISMARDAQSLDSDHSSLESKDKALTAAKEASRKALEEQRKADEARVAAMNEDHATFQAQQAQTVADEMNFWEMELKTQKVGGKAYLEAFKNFATEKQKLLQETMAEVAKFQAETVKATLPDQFDLARDHEAVRAAAGVPGAEITKPMNASLDLTRQYIDALQDQSLAEAVATGRMTARDAAIQKLGIHYQQYLNLLERMKASGKSADDIQHVTETYQLQAVADQFAVVTGSFSGQWKTTLNEMSNQFRDFGGELTGTFRQTINNINDEIIHLLTTRHTTAYSTRQQFKAVGKEAFSGLADTGLKGIEGYGLKALGFGSKGTPAHVIVDNMPGAPGSPAGNAAGGLQSLFRAGANGIGGFFSKLMGGGSQTASSASSGSPFSGLFGDVTGLVSALPAFASGGPVSAGMTALVGEEGPELVKFGRSGTVIPNSRLTAGDIHHHTHIDARGSTNPAETKRMVLQAIAAARPGMIRDSLHASREYTRRRPSSAH